MPVNTPNKAYKATIDQVIRVGDCYEGSDAVKDKGDEYLPMLGGQSIAEYEAYKMRGYYLPVIKPSATALTGAIMRKDMVVEKPDSLNVVIGDDEALEVDNLASLSITELMVRGRGLYLVEHDTVNPSIKFYNRESIINWTDDIIVLCQNYTVVDDKDRFVTHIKKEYLELTFDEDGKYTQRVWRQKNNKSQFEVHDTLRPDKRGEPLDYIPAVFFNTLAATDDLTPPALLEMADISLDHYRLSTDLRHGLHNTALPTMFVFGDIKDENGKQVNLTVGPGSANHIPDEEARAELLEFTGAGLDSINKTLGDDVDQMAAIGAKMFGSTSLGVKAAETARIEASGESATLSTIAASVESALTMAYKICADWQGLPMESISVTLNRDFLDSRLSPQDTTALLSAYIQGGISLDTFLHNLKKGDVLPKGVTVEDEKVKIQGGELNLA